MADCQANLNFNASHVDGVFGQPASGRPCTKQNSHYPCTPLLPLLHRAARKAISAKSEVYLFVCCLANIYAISKTTPESSLNAQSCGCNSINERAIIRVPVLLPLPLPLPLPLAFAVAIAAILVLFLAAFGHQHPTV